MSKPAANPSDIARETLIKLASRKTPPTPGNYARIYAEISGAPEDAGPAGAGANDEAHRPWAVLIRDLLRQLETPHKGLTIVRKKEGLETVLKRFASDPDALFEKISGLMRSWAESPVTPPATAEVEPASQPSPPPASPAPPPQTGVMPSGATSGEMAQQLGELLAQALESLLSTLPELSGDAHTLVQQVRAIRSPEQLATLNKQLRQFWIKAELHSGDKTKIHDGLIRLLRLLVENIGEMVEDDEWLHGQVSILQDIIANPIDRRSIADAERGLRDAIIKQGLLKQNLIEAKTTLKNLMTTFVDRLGEITTSTGAYHQKIEGYSKKISKSKNLADLSHLLEDIMQDTRTIQTSALRSHEELVQTRKQVQESETRIRQLEQELSQVSEMVREDQLTGALNRRGLDAAFEHDAAHADRTESPLCVALLDIDNFKRLNDTQGHQTGDQALIHLSSVIKEALRPSDSVARYGGEEFVILLPDTPLEEGAATIERLQRELTRRFFLHENERILITFSAGVAQRDQQEPQDEVIGRADKAMYQAKHSGKNRVIAAPPPR
ncbi:MAG: diguanylate cyclase [Gallionellales bacterium GWA2_60_142]|nr:MAG: diguanylate cyclase [Gallionellales bacterium GWA2_60_142]HCI14200.1 GGDEF domain-containing protein [Gallionellaceae bacterium]